MPGAEFGEVGKPLADRAFFSLMVLARRMSLAHRTPDARRPLFCLSIAFVLPADAALAGQPRSHGRRTEENTENIKNQTSLMPVSGAGRPDLLYRQEQHIMDLALSILTLASDAITMAAAVVTMIDITLRRRANHSKG